MYNWNPPHTHELPARYWEPGADDKDMIRGEDTQDQSNGRGVKTPRIKATAAG